MNLHQFESEEFCSSEGEPASWERVRDLLGELDVRHGTVERDRGLGWVSNLGSRVVPDRGGPVLARKGMVALLLLLQGELLVLHRVAHRRDQTVNRARWWRRNKFSSLLARTRQGHAWLSQAQSRSAWHT